MYRAVLSFDLLSFNVLFWATLYSVVFPGSVKPYLLAPPPKHLEIQEGLLDAPIVIICHFCQSRQWQIIGHTRHSSDTNLISKGQEIFLIFFLKREKR